MLKAIELHIQSIDKTGELATMVDMDSIDVSKGLIRIKDHLLKLTTDKEVGAVLVYDLKTNDLDIIEVFHGDEESVEIKFPSSAKSGDKIVVGDIHTHPPTRHAKDIVYLAPSAQDMLATAKRIESTEAVYKYYMLAVVVTIEGAYTMMATNPPKYKALETHLTSKEIHSQQMRRVKENSIKLTTGMESYDLSTSLVRERFPNHTGNLNSTINLVHTSLSTTYNDITTEQIPGFAQLLYETSLAQCVGMLEGTCIRLFYGGWTKLDKLSHIKGYQSADLVYQRYVQSLKGSQQKGQLKEYMEVKNPTKGTMTSSSYGLRCCLCLKVHQSTIGSVFGRWHRCGKCRSVFCDKCGKTLKTRWPSTFSISKVTDCKFSESCGGTTSFLY